MRLRQLARKLGLKPAEIVNFLAENHISIEDDSNTRLEDLQVELVLKKFAPGELMSTEWKEEEPAVEEKPSVTIAEPAPQAEAAPVETEITPPEKPEVIKAPKVELSGLKVLGKIDLPQPKKKTDSVPSEEFPAPGKPVPENRKPTVRRKQEPRLWKNPLEEQREREARDAKRKRQQMAEQAKAQRTDNYLKKVKPSAPTKRAKLVEEASLEMSDAELADPPKTWLGKLIRWFRT